MDGYHGPPIPKRRRIQIHTPPSIIFTLPLTSASTGSSTNLSLLTPEHFETPIPDIKSSLNMDETVHEAERYPSGLEAAGYDPVWTSTDGYPGQIPEEIVDCLYPDAARYDRIIGPISSIFWLQGVEFLTELIDDPGYALQDEVTYLPQGSPKLWIVGRLYDEGKIPRRFMDCILSGYEMPTLSEGPASSKELARNSQIPQGISTSVQQFQATDLFPFGRRDPRSALISGAKIKWDKNSEKFATAIETTLLAEFGDHLLFRGLSRQALLSLMAVFCPVIGSTHSDNEFGPGFYATPSVRVAARYAGPSGVILVFKRLPESLTNLTLSGPDWEAIVRFWTGNPLSNQDTRVPANWQGADVLEGAIPKAVSSQDSRRVEGPDTQVVGVSLESFKAFSSALQMIIWVD